MNSIAFKYSNFVEHSFYDAIEKIGDEFAKNNHLFLYNSFIEECGGIWANPEIKQVYYYEDSLGKRIEFVETNSPEWINSNRDYADSLDCIYDIILASADTENKIDSAAKKYLPIINSKFDLEEFWTSMARRNGSELWGLAAKKDAVEPVRAIVKQFYEDMKEAMEVSNESN